METSPDLRALMNVPCARTGEPMSERAARGRTPHPDGSPDVRDLVEEYCARTGMTKTAIARELGASSPQFHGMLAGNAGINADRRQILAGRLGIPVEQLSEVIGRGPRLRVKAEVTETPLKQYVSRHLRERGQTVRSLIRGSGIGYGTLFDVLAGKSQPAPSTLSRLIAELGVPGEEVVRAAGLTVPDGVCGRFVVARWTRGWTLTEVAERCGLSQATVAAVEEGTLPEHHQSAFRLATVLGIPSAELLALYPAEAETPFGRLLHETMVCRGLIQADIAEATGGSRQAVSRWLVGTDRPSRGNLAKIVKEFDLDEWEFTTAWQESKAPTPTRSPFALALAAKRYDRGLTQRQLAALIGVTTSMLGQWESGQASSPPSKVMIKRLEAVLGLLPDPRQSGGQVAA